MNEQRERKKKKKATEKKDNLPAINVGAEVVLTDFFPPLNHVSYERFKMWKKENKAHKEETKVHKLQDRSVSKTTMQQEYKWEDYTNLHKTIGELYEPYRVKYKDAANFVEKEKTQPIPEPKGLDDMLNILLSVNYLTGYTEFLNAKK